MRDWFNRLVCGTINVIRLFRGGCLYMPPGWHSDIQCYGRRCVTCGRMKPHRWFTETHLTTLPAKAEKGAGE